MKRMSEKQWYETLNRYSKLTQERQEYGDYFTKMNELIDLQHLLLMEMKHIKSDLLIIQSDCRLDEVEDVQGLTDRIYGLLSKIEALQPITEEACEYTYIKATWLTTKCIVTICIIIIIPLLVHFGIL